MRTFKNNLKRNRNRGSQDRSFKRSIDISRLNTDFGNRDNGFRRKNNRNNGNVEKLITKYNELAREALSNGDKILSENYLQHADHFTRILYERESFKKEKHLDVKSENNSQSSNESFDASSVNSKELEDNSSEQVVAENSSKSQVEIT